jgi:hypothetical protein
MGCIGFLARAVRLLSYKLRVAEEKLMVAIDANAPLIG